MNESKISDSAVTEYEVHIKTTASSSILENAVKAINDTTNDIKRLLAERCGISGKDVHLENENKEISDDTKYNFERKISFVCKKDDILINSVKNLLEDVNDIEYTITEKES